MSPSHNPHSQGKLNRPFSGSRNWRFQKTDRESMQRKEKLLTLDNCCHGNSHQAPAFSGGIWWSPGRISSPRLPAPIAGTEPAFPLIASIFTQQDLSAWVPSAQGSLLLPPLYSFPKAHDGSSCYQASICSLQWALPSLYLSCSLSVM